VFPTILYMSVQRKAAWIWSTTRPLPAAPYTVLVLAPSGATLYVRLWSNVGGFWQYNDYTYTAANLPLATMASPTPGTVLSGPSVVFTWNGNAGISQYSLWIGTRRVA